MLGVWLSTCIGFCHGCVVPSVPFCCSWSRRSVSRLGCDKLSDPPNVVLFDRTSVVPTIAQLLRRHTGIQFVRVASALVLVNVADIQGTVYMRLSDGAKDAAAATTQSNTKQPTQRFCTQSKPQKQISVRKDSVFRI